MNLSWDKDAWEDYVYWQQTDKTILRRINELIREAMRTPFEGKGKPEPLRANLSGYWSRRITDEHRLVYKVDADRIHIIQCRLHYWLVPNFPEWVHIRFHAVGNVFFDNRIVFSVSNLFTFCFWLLQLVGNGLKLNLCGFDHHITIVDI